MVMEISFSVFRLKNATTTNADLDMLNIFTCRGNLREASDGTDHNQTSEQNEWIYLINYLLQVTGRMTLTLHHEGYTRIPRSMIHPSHPPQSINSRKTRNNKFHGFGFVPCMCRVDFRPGVSFCRGTTQQYVKLSWNLRKC